MPFTSPDPVVTGNFLPASADRFRFSPRKRDLPGRAFCTQRSGLLVPTAV
ncbi:hypothetical protein ACI48J_10430 [Paenibacillus chitinolyticus]